MRSAILASKVRKKKARKPCCKRQWIETIISIHVLYVNLQTFMYAWMQINIVWTNSPSFSLPVYFTQKILNRLSKWQDLIIWASSWDYGTYHIGEKWRLRLEPSLFVHMEYGSRRRVRPKIRLAPLDGWLRMCVWRMSLRRTKGIVNSWVGSYH